ncbi:DNA-formamidopyrimidine glycosylase [Staphylococcus sp. HMSC036D05]|uniref:bifunctional DNA-formamidopyrimidine glycosylase/DNA-(apurinic or apyrimidinic site) lyase n=1 Tax=Staphylococcus sp. HMSC036D05 TaxID=1715059 RepID=UPI0008A9B769|nr:bifunctional DNA-formamidopyrimidine glycosylase/DNA-(apurinic or apyrimidinic site) lyase [Staphylococcus sp. HMSC036D05]OHO70448.1 DNA-formamidopyrimidine glycosylase [Staphylococcus sp. HMSC036D05]
MPELPEVEHVKRGIEPYIKNERIKKVIFSDNVIKGKKDNRETIIKGMELDSFAKLTEGYTITRVLRRSKYIVLHIERDNDQRILISHLGMAGGFFVVDDLEDIATPNYRKHWQVIFELENEKKLVYSDIRRFGEIRNVAGFESYPPFLEIAPEPFEEEALAHYLSCFDINKYANKPIKQMILDHKVIAGAGNIYACEALFRAGIRPDKIAHTLNHQEREMLFYYVREVLKEGIKYGGTSISDYRHADGKTGEMQLHLNVYKQKYCKICGHEIETKVIATRNSHFCPNCQK